ncbi:MAG TPA: S8 family serine peptidase [Candidatus Bathyarchaeia archaeon]|nr:S8 family serine peptidase [Candidatus Bathyarchaeia archaeon]
MQKPQWADQDNNAIADTLDTEILQRTFNQTADNYANVTVMLKNPPTFQNADLFTQNNGYLITQPWTHALYGFGGHIPYNQINNYIQADQNVLLIEKQQRSQAHIAYAARQIGARTYVWNNLSLQGDPQTSIAILDTGLDDSHPDFTPGYGDLNFSKKIVGWNDQISPGTTSPYDDNGHGSHVAGLATGTGFVLTNASNGNALATWSAGLGAISPSGTYIITGFMVNKTGTIRVNVKWRNAGIPGTGTMSRLSLSDGDKSLDQQFDWRTRAFVNTPSEDVWYGTTYPVSTLPAGGYNKWHILLSFAAGLGDNFYVTIRLSWPYTPPSDGYQAWTGIAPQTRLVGLKVLDNTGGGWDYQFLNAIDWIIANKETYHIVIASMSLGFGAEVTAANEAIVNLVNSGVTTIVSAGNSGGDGNNRIHTPGSVDEALTVAALNQFDNLASYSSEGGTSYYQGNTIKPDIAAPGGSFLATPLMSADTNDNDAEGTWTDFPLNDAAPMQGTSMSAPVVSGAASIVIQAMGGFSNWQYTRTQALQPKMILLMTATETYPLYREPFSAYSPTLQRGGKDQHEGYGRLNLDAAVDALLKTHQIGTTVTATLGRPPAITDIATLGQKLAWARKVQLTPDVKYNFTLTVPAGADYDLYLYNSTGTSYGEPSIVTKSTTATTGGQEQIILNNAPYNGTYYLIVKRARADTGTGTFTLRSKATPNHEITTQTVEPNPLSVYPTDTVNITVTVKNNGLSTESFNVTAFYNTTAIDTQPVWNLPPNNTTTLNFTWNTAGDAPSHYTIKAQADAVPNEYNATDNTYTYIGTVTVKLPGDANGDDTVNADDLAIFQPTFGATLTSINWNPECDFNRDNIIDARDLRLLGRNYGRAI